MFSSLRFGHAGHQGSARGLSSQLRWYHILIQWEASHQPWCYHKSLGYPRGRALFWFCHSTILSQKVSGTENAGTDWLSQISSFNHTSTTPQQNQDMGPWDFLSCLNTSRSMLPIHCLEQPDQWITCHRKTATSSHLDNQCQKLLAFLNGK